MFKTSRDQYVSLALGAPIAKLSISSNNPAASLTGYGFSDLFSATQGWVARAAVGRRDRVHGVRSDGKVRTSRRAALAEATGRTSSLGGALHFDSTRTTRVSALASYRSQHAIAQHRGAPREHVSDPGWSGRWRREGRDGRRRHIRALQATRDRGADIPPALLGQWSRVDALGPELDRADPELPLRADARVEWEFGCPIRPQGNVVTVGFAYQVSTPSPARRPSRP